MHMRPQISSGPFLRVTHIDGSVDLFDGDDSPGQIDGTDEIETITDKFFHRLSAPGYLDCTDWSGPFDARVEAVEDLLRTYADDVDSDHPDFEEWRAWALSEDSFFFDDQGFACGEPATAPAEETNELPVCESPESHVVRLTEDDWKHIYRTIDEQITAYYNKLNLPDESPQESIMTSIGYVDVGSSGDRESAWVEMFGERVEWDDFPAIAVPDVLSVAVSKDEAPPPEPGGTVPTECLKCFECGRKMTKEECGDETEEERVCDACAGQPHGLAAQVAKLIEEWIGQSWEINALFENEKAPHDREAILRTAFAMLANGKDL